MKKLITLILTLIIIATSACALNAAPTAAPAPGKWEIYPRTLVEGTETPLEIRYMHTGDDLKPGEGFHMVLEKLSVSTLFLCPMSETIEIIPFKGELPKNELKKAPVHGVGYRELDITFPDGLKKGDSFAIAFGNKQPDCSIKALITPFPMTNLGLPIYTRDADGKQTDWVDAGWFDNVPHCDIVAGPASDLRVFLPSLVQTGKPFPLRISVTDGLDSRANPVFTGKLTIKVLSDANAGINGLPSSVTLDKKDACYKTIQNLTINKEGVYRVAVTMPDGRTVESNPVVVRKQVDQPVYWGNMHNHGQYSECWGMDNDWFYTTARTVSGMDYVALSDHIYHMPANSPQTDDAGRLYKWRNGHSVTSLAAWKDTVETSDRHNDPKGGFVTITGYEAGGVDPGHFNVYMPDVTMSNMDKMFTPERRTPYVREVRDLVEKLPAIYIYHLHAVPFEWTTIEDDALAADGKLLSPCVEIYSDWGNSFLPYDKTIVDSRFGGLRSPVALSALWALGKGIKFGCIGDADAHTGLPGRRIVGSPAMIHDHAAGLTAAMTADFSRQGIINAYKDRSVYATTGEHIFLDFKINDTGMGKDLATDAPLSIFIQIAGTDEITKVTLWNGLNKVYTATPNTRDAILTFQLPAPDHTQQKAYVVEVTQKDGNMAWSSPIWVSKAGVPDLAWEKRADGLYLINKGKATATNIEVGYSPTAHPFTKPSIKGLPDMAAPDAGYLWTDRRDDETVFLHYRWQGDKPVKITMLTPGITCDPKDDINVNSAWGRSTRKTKGAGNYELVYDLNLIPRPFATAPGKNKDYFNYSPGLSWIMKTDTAKPAQVVLKFDREVTTYMNNQPVKTNILRVPLNGLTAAAQLTITTIDTLAPGEAYKVTGEKGYWSADPNNKIAESDEGNNLYEAR